MLYPLESIRPEWLVLTKKNTSGLAVAFTTTADLSVLPLKHELIHILTSAAENADGHR